MNAIFKAHSGLGMYLLPLLTVALAVYLTVTWRPGASRQPAARIFSVLVSIQFLLGLIYYVYGLIAGASARYLSFPFILHPIFGLVAVYLSTLAARPRGRLARLERWAPLASLAVVLVLVLLNIAIAKNR